MATWTYYICEVTTGNVVDQLDLAEFSGKQTITSDGDLSASIPVSGLDSSRVREILQITSPGKYSIVADRNGEAVGEWIVWKRSRSTDGSALQMVGTEFLSYLSRREVPNLSATGVDQLTIAKNLITAGISGDGAGHGTVAMTVPTVSSGVLTLVNYLAGEATVLQRLQDLANSQPGFEFILNVAWATGSTSRVVRTVSFGYPRLGITQDMVFEVAEQGASGGSATAMTIVEDATLLASKAWALGAGTGPSQVIGIASSSALLNAGYPMLEVTRSWSNDARQDAINGYANALLAISQSAETPPTLTVLADGDPRFGDYNIGDVVTCQVGAQAAFPDGWTFPVRITAWTIAPPSAGIEAIDLEVTSAYALPGGN